MEFIHYVTFGIIVYCFLCWGFAFGFNHAISASKDEKPLPGMLIFLFPIIVVPALIIDTCLNYKNKRKIPKPEPDLKNLQDYTP